MQARSLANFEMSAPDTNALPPAPVSTTTRTSLSAAKASSASLVACHISSDTALWRNGLLKVTRPTPASLRARILSVGDIVFISCFAVIASFVCSDRLGLAQRGNLALGKAEFLEHRAGMFALAGRPPDQAGGRARERHRLRKKRERLRLPFALPAADGLRDFEMPHLRIGKHLVDGINRAARHPGGVEQLDPLGAAMAVEGTLDLGVERVAILGSRGGGGVCGLARHRRIADGFAKAVPHFAAGGGDVDQAVCGLEHAGRHGGRMIVAGFLGPPPPARKRPGPGGRED